MSDKKPLPNMNADTKPFWEGCRAHQLKIQTCGNCGIVRWPPSFICPKCHSQDTRWIDSSGKGTVYSFIVYHKAFHPAFTGELPYTVALVELDEGPRMIANIVECNHDEIYCDMAVEVTWNDRTDEFSIPLFRPVGKQET